MKKNRACLSSLVLGAAVLVAVSLGAARSALALSPEEAATRDELVKAAQKAHRDNNHARSLELYQKAAALETTPSLLYWMVWEQQELGQLADAYAGAQRCLKELARNPTVRNAAQIRQGCTALESQLKERVGRIEVRVADPAPDGLVVKLAGRELNRAMIGVPYVISPGTVLVEAEAPSRSPFRLEIDVPEGKTVNVTVTMARADRPDDRKALCGAGQVAGPDGRCLAAQDSCQLGMERIDGSNGRCCWPGQSWDAAAGRCAGVPRCPLGLHGGSGDSCVPDAPVAEPGDSRQPAPTFWRPYRRPAIGFAAAGVGLLVAGTAFRLIGNSKFDTLKDQCNGPGGCTAQAYDDGKSTVNRYDALSLVGWIGGGACLAAGAAFYYLSVYHYLTPEGPPMGVAVDPQHKAIALTWTF